MIFVDLTQAFASHDHKTIYNILDWVVKLQIPREYHGLLLAYLNCADDIKMVSNRYRFRFKLLQIREMQSRHLAQTRKKLTQISSQCCFMLAKPGIEPEINDIRKTFILITWKRTMLTPSRIWFGGLILIERESPQSHHVRCFQFTARRPSRRSSRPFGSHQVDAHCTYRWKTVSIKTMCYATGKIVNDLSL